MAGHGQTVCLIGDAGIGKSRLARAVLDAAVRDGAMTLQIDCTPSTGQYTVVSDQRTVAAHRQNLADQFQ